MDLADHRCTEGVDVFRSNSFVINFGGGVGRAPYHRACGVWWPMGMSGQQLTAAAAVLSYTYT